MKAYRFILTRSVELVLTVLFVLTITFVMSRVVPSDPARALAGAFASQDVVDNIRRLYGLNLPLYVQYVNYLIGFLHGNLGLSIVSHRPVTEDIAQYLPVSVQLVVASMIISVILGVALGTIAASRNNKKSGLLANVAALAGYSLPAFWIGIILQLVMGFYLRVLPVSGLIDPSVNLQHISGLTVVDSVLTFNLAALQSSLSHLILPAFVLSLGELGIVAKFVRATMLEELQQDYVRTARAYGFPERVVQLKYTLKNTLIPLVTHLGFDFGTLFGYTVLIEFIFQYPGIGLYLTNAILSLDFSAITGTAIVLATIVVVTNTAVDILYVYIDPRLRRDTVGVAV